MQKSFVIVAVDLFTEPAQEPGFRYRAYVNQELFTERTWLWDEGYYLEENLQILAYPGEYTIDFTVHGTPSSMFKAQNFRVVKGPGKIVDNKLVLE
jgi:hypothetical protein